MSNSDITYDTSAFDPKNIPENTKNVTNYLISQALNGPGGPAFWEVRSNSIISGGFYVELIHRLVPRSFEVSKTKARPAGQHRRSDSTMQRISIFHLVRMAGKSNVDLCSPKIERQKECFFTLMVEVMCLGTAIGMFSFLLPMEL
jgi:hypothetical protein